MGVARCLFQLRDHRFDKRKDLRSDNIVAGFLNPNTGVRIDLDTNTDVCSTPSRLEIKDYVESDKKGCYFSTHVNGEIAYCSHEIEGSSSKQLTTITFICLYKTNIPTINGENCILPQYKFTKINLAKVSKKLQFVFRGFDASVYTDCIKIDGTYKCPTNISEENSYMECHRKYPIKITEQGNVYCDFPFTYNGIQFDNCVVDSGTKEEWCLSNYGNKLTCKNRQIGASDLQCGDCVNGVCSTTVESQAILECICFTGWAGIFCDEVNRCDLEYSSDFCIKPGICNYDLEQRKENCHCTVEYSGDHCEHFTPCENLLCNPKYSRCLANEKSLTFNCTCHSGFTGQYCFDEIPCYREDYCYNGGICTSKKQRFGPRRPNSGVNDFSNRQYFRKLGGFREGDVNYIELVTCVCSKDFTGDRCEIGRNPCKQTTNNNTNDTPICNHRGDCEYISDFEHICKCYHNFTGANCENNMTMDYINKCNSSCLDNQCVYFKTEWVCIGNDPCDGVDCNMGYCLSDERLTRHKCVCNPNFSGEFCNVARIECSQSPCKHNGTCIKSTNSKSFQCICPPLYIGVICENEKLFLRSNFNSWNTKYKLNIFLLASLSFSSLLFSYLFITERRNRRYAYYHALMAGVPKESLPRTSLLATVCNVLCVMICCKKRYASNYTLLSLVGDRRK